MKNFWLLPLSTTCCYLDKKERRWFSGSQRKHYTWLFFFLWLTWLYFIDIAYQHIHSFIHSFNRVSVTLTQNFARSPAPHPQGPGHQIRPCCFFSHPVPLFSHLHFLFSWIKKEKNMTGGICEKNPIYVAQLVFYGDRHEKIRDQIIFDFIKIIF